ncbi:MAG: hypothetical protein R6V03_08740 [Kiritimatiellia bacterium]
MRLFSREAWSYAALLIVLFAMAALAVWRTLLYLEEQMAIEQFKIVTVILWTLTMGFMLTAGAFGMWAIRFSTEAESRRRIGHLVSAMDYLQDGLLVVDKRGHITGSNPSARKMVNSPLTGREDITEVFDGLTRADRDLLLRASRPVEIEREQVVDGESRVIRFRGQAGEALNLVLLLVSDVTAMNLEHLQRRQTARIQLINQITRGITHDLNNLLLGISGHASVLQRNDTGPEAFSRSLKYIRENAERGLAVANHLVELSKPVVTGKATELTSEHLHNAADDLRNSLPEGWSVKETIEPDLPAVSLSALQVEQLVLNVGLLAAERAGQTANLLISAGRAGSGPLMEGDARAACVVLVTAAPSGTDSFAGLGSRPSTNTSAVSAGESTYEAGVIESVIRSMLEEQGGDLEILATADASTVYRIRFPRGTLKTNGVETDAPLPQELKSYVSHWTILLGGTRHTARDLSRRLAKLGLETVSVDNIASALSTVQEHDRLDAMMLDERLMGTETAGLLKAVLKLRPEAGIVVLCENPRSQPKELAGEVVFVPHDVPLESLLNSAIEARTMSTRRKKA